MSKKKPSFPIQDFLSQYLERYNRRVLTPVFYDDLLRFTGSVAVYDPKNKQKEKKPTSFIK